MRLLVTGRVGQVVTALSERAGDNLDIIALGRPELDLAAPGDLASLFAPHRPDAIVNAAAYTAVDQAEKEPELASAVNGAGAGAVAAAAKTLGVPVIQISTDYVFDGSKPTPYVETDPVGPVGAYGRSKLAGEQAVAAATDNHAILRTAWVYAAEGKNFVRTMLRLAADRPELAVVADQRGCPSYAPDLADAIVRVAQALVTHPERGDLRGVFHMSGSGETDWASFATEIFAISKAHGGPATAVRRISTADYPTPARRPSNSRLDCTKLHSVYGIPMPDWREALARCMSRVESAGGKAN